MGRYSFSVFLVGMGILWQPQAFATSVTAGTAQCSNAPAYARPDFTGWKVIDLDDYPKQERFTFGPSENVVFYGSSTTRTEDLYVDGGNRIAVIGGKFAPVANGNPSSGILFFKDIKKEIYIEGVHIDSKNSAGSDGIVLNGNGSSPVVATIQNTLVENIQGTFSGRHGDVIQPQGRVSELRIHNLSGSSNYQGLFLDYQDGAWGGKADKVVMENVDLRHLPGENDAHFMLWFDEASRQQVQLKNVWTTQQDGRAPERQAVAPKNGVRSGNSISWPSSHIQGSVNVGTPAGGSFVTANEVGAGYSPCKTASPSQPTTPTQPTTPAQPSKPDQPSTPATPDTDEPEDC